MLSLHQNGLDEVLFIHFFPALFIILSCHFPSPIIGGFLLHDAQPRITVRS